MVDPREVLMKLFNDEVGIGGAKAMLWKKISQEDLEKLAEEVDKEIENVPLCWDKGCRLARIVDP